jgi:hypothetical protein
VPSAGLNAPISTWYRPRYAPDLSIASTCRGSSTTHTTVASRFSSAQIEHGSDSATLQQRLQRRVAVSACSIARARSRELGSRSTWNARRSALRRPTPGKRSKAATSASSGSG